MNKIMIKRETKIETKITNETGRFNNHDKNGRNNCHTVLTNFVEVSDGRLQFRNN